MTFTQPAAATPGLELTEEAAGYVAALHQLNREIGDLEAARTELRQRIEKLLGEHEVGLVDGRALVTWKWDTPTTVLDVTRVKDEQPELWAAYQKPRRQARRFTLITPRDSDG